MEAVRAFNNELSSLYDTKPPVSKAKMASVTKSAIKAIKFYKHVVQSVEKFIQKCRPEYKVPGLYVIDSIVRQSRHQFGAEKDVFAPRFMKNICATFQNLFKCPPDQKSKIVRVLNLWQKNNVMPSEVIQPMMDVAADPNNAEAIAAAQQAVQVALGETANKTTPAKAKEEGMAEQQAGADWLPQAESDTDDQNDVLKTVAQLLEQSQTQTGSSLSAQQQQLQQLQYLQQQLVQQTHMLQHPQSQSAAQPIIDSNLLSQIQTLTNQLLSKTQEDTKPPEPAFNKKLLDFDYGESDDEEDKKEENRHNADSSLSGTVQNLLNDPNIMQQIQQMSATIQKNEELKSELSLHEERQKLLQQQQEEFDKQIQLQHQQQGAAPPDLPPAQPPLHHHHHHHHQGPPPPHMPPHHLPPPGMDMSLPPPQPGMPPEPHMHHHQYQMPPMSGMADEPSGNLEDSMQEERDDRDRYRDKERDRYRKRSRSRSPSSRRRKRSRSRSRDRDRKRRSRSRDRHKSSRSEDRDRDRDRERDRENREKERERKKKGLPPVKENHLSICSTTLWIGHLSKQTTEDDLRNEVENYGEILTVTLVLPRGCAFVCMKNRKDAAKALDRLKGGKILGNILKVAWAPNKGINESKFKEKWDVELGVTYLPWNEMPADLEALSEGGVIDEETLPKHLRQNPQDVENSDQNQNTSQMDAGQPPGMLPSVMPQFEQPVPGMVPMIPPPPVGVMPPMMMPGQMPPNIPPPSARIAMTTSPVVPGMIGAPVVGGPLGLPRGVPPVQLAGLPHPAVSQGNVNGEHKLEADLVGNLSSSAGNQLAMAIQNIVSNSSTITSVVSQSTPGVMRPGLMGTRPGVPPPNFNPQLPPPNFRLPPPSFDPRRPPPPGHNQMGEQGPGAPGAPAGHRPLVRPGAGLSIVRTPGDKPSLSQMIENWPKKYAPPNENGDLDEDMDEDGESPGLRGTPQSLVDGPMAGGPPRKIEGFGIRPPNPQMGGPGTIPGGPGDMPGGGPRGMMPLAMMQQRFPGMGNRPERPNLPGGHQRFPGPGGSEVPGIGGGPQPMRMRGPGGFPGNRMGGPVNFAGRGNGPQVFQPGFRGPNPSMNIRPGMERPRAPGVEQWGMEQKWGGGAGPDNIKQDRGQDAGRNFPDRDQQGDFNRKDHFGFDGRQGNQGENEDRWGGGGNRDRWGGPRNRGPDRGGRDFDRRRGDDWEDRFGDNDRRDRFGGDDDGGRDRYNNDRRERFSGQDRSDRDRFSGPDRFGRGRDRDRGDRDREDRGRDRRGGYEERDDFGGRRRNSREFERESRRSRWASGSEGDKPEDKDAPVESKDSSVRPLMGNVKPLMELTTMPSKPIELPKEGEGDAADVKPSESDDKTEESAPQDVRQTAAKQETTAPEPPSEKPVVPEPPITTHSEPAVKDNPVQVQKSEPEGAAPAVEQPPEADAEEGKEEGEIDS